MQNWFQAPASLLHHQVKNSGLYPLCPDLGSRRTLEGGEGQRGKRKDRMHKGLFCCCSLEQAKSKGEGSTQCLGSGSGTMSHRFPPAFSCLGGKHLSIHGALGFQITLLMATFPGLPLSTFPEPVSPQESAPSGVPFSLLIYLIITLDGSLTPQHKSS